MNPVKYRQDQIQNGWLIAILFAQIDKIFENVVRPDEYLPTPMNIVFQYFTHALTTILLWILWSFFWIKFKMVDLLPFLFAQIAKIFENFVCPDEYIHYTNAYLFPIFYTCKIYICPMNPENFVRIKFKMVDFSPFLFAQIDKIFENFVRPDEYLQHQWIFVSDILHLH